MLKSITLAGAFASAILAATATVQAGSATPVAGNLAPMQAQPATKAENVANYLPVLRVGCVANGTPSEFPNDILFTNRGSKLNAGARLRWTFTSPNLTGTYTLTSALNAGASVRASNVVPGGIEAGRYCSVTVK
jgi:hypothetical protein